MTARTEAPELQGPGEVSPRAKRWAVIVAALLVITAAIGVLLMRLHRRHLEGTERASLQEESARGLRISVTRVRTTPAARIVALPGDVHGFDQVTLYAKLSGYVRQVRVERGERVQRGQILATIESPESQREVAAAAHDANVARLNAERAEKLAPSGVVAQQDRDNAVARSRIAGANLQRARDLFAYTVVRAPFDGVVTARYVDPGALVPAATGATQAALPIADIADVDTLRIFVYVGQDTAPFVRAGDAVTIWQDEMPDKRIPATVTRAAGALDPRTRTMQVEIDVDNRSWGLLPGTFAHVELRIAEPPSPTIPDEAMVIRDGKTMVVEVNAGKAHYLPVDLGYNDGREVRVLRGLSGGETVGLDVPIEVEEGNPVQAVEGLGK
jgi:RND family efflux transporter MFP subunit